MEKIASAQGLTLVNAGYVYDPELLARLPEVYPDIELHRLDAAAVAQDFEELDPDEQDLAHALLEAAVPTLRPFGCHPEARKFQPAELPALFVAGSDARFLRSIEQSKETADPLFQGVLESLQSRRVVKPGTTLVLNFRNALVRRLGLVSSQTIIARAVQVLYVQGLLLAQEPLTSRELALLSQGLAGLIDSVIESTSQRSTGDTQA
jgi:molecular chaperone HtpG